MDKLTEIRAKMDALRTELKTEVTEAREASGSKAEALVESIRTKNNELESLANEAKPLEAVDAELKRAERYSAEMSEVEDHPGHAAKGDAPSAEVGFKSLGEHFADEYAGKKGQEVKIAEDVSAMGLKTLFTTTAGWGPQNINTGRLVQSAQKPVQVMDLIPGAVAGAGNAVAYWKEVTFTNNAAAVKEAGEYAESALKIEEASATVKKIGTYLPITDEALEDVAMTQAYVNNRLVTMVQLKLDQQIVAGENSEGELDGFLHISGTQEQALGGDTRSAAILKALTKVRTGTGQANPTAVLINPADWQDIRLERTEDGIYLWGPPSEAGPMTIFGVPVYPVQAMTEGTALTGDFAVHSALAMKKGVNVKVSDSHSDFFIKGKQAIRCDVRAALVVYRPAAFVKVTGI